MKGASKPLGLFTIDLYLDDLPPSKRPEDSEFTKQEKYEIDKEKKRILTETLDNDEWDLQEYMSVNKDMMLTFQKFDPVFLGLFKQAF